MNIFLKLLTDKKHIVWMMLDNFESLITQFPSEGKGERRLFVSGFILMRNYKKVNFGDQEKCKN